MPNGAELHLALNHLPLIVPIVGIGVLAAGLWYRSRAVERVGFCLLAIGAMAALPVYLSGESAEQIAKNYPGVSRLLIHEHEAAALLSSIALGIPGLLSLPLLWLSVKRSAPRSASMTLLLLAVIAAALVARTAHLGGKIRHEEIRSDDRF